MHDLVVAITGGSGSIYAIRLLEVLRAAGRSVHVVISPAGADVLGHELGIKLDLENVDPADLVPDPDLADDSKLGSLRSGSDSANALSSIFGESDTAPGDLVYHHYLDYSAGIASGSFPTDGMVICPCSMGSLSSLANGLSSNLIHRAAEVHLKERRRLIVVPRETPLSGIQLENMKRLADAGVVVLPAMPGFYHHPATIHDLIDFIVGRICDHLGISQELSRRWGE